jgi:Protein of unknown function (DUF1573)
MKQIISLLLISVITLITISCKNKPSASVNGFVKGDSEVNNIPTQDTLKWTEVLWIDTLKDLGNLKKGGLVEVSFRFKNIGKNPLSINRVTPGCGCTQAEKPSKQIAPGEESLVKAQFNTENQSGKVNKHITVEYNAKQSVKDLEFTALVEENNKQ